MPRRAKDNRKKMLLIVGSGAMAGGIIALALTFLAPQAWENKEPERQISENPAPSASTTENALEKKPQTSIYAERFEALPPELQECVKKALGEKLHRSLMEDPAFVISNAEQPKVKESVRCYNEYYKKP